MDIFIFKPRKQREGGEQLLNECVYDLYINRLKELIIVFRRVKIILRYVG
jgi:hypothetical protein